MKHASEWFYSTVFRDEAIAPKPYAPVEKLPSLLRAARSLENSPNGSYRSRESVFLKQAKLLANYEDDYRFSSNVVHYYPTYQSLTDPELRGYFTWRTALRRGDVQKTSLSFAFLYIYELINKIGVSSPLEGYRKLADFRDAYGQLDSRILPYLKRWMTDYVAYYGLDADLLENTPQVIFDRSLAVLDRIAEQDEATVMCALKQLAPKWLSRSRFYAQYRADCDTVIVRVLRGISDHYARHTNRTMVEQFLGKQYRYPRRLFCDAVFCDPLKIRNYEFAVDERCIYRCQNGQWTVTGYMLPLCPADKLEDLLKAIDAVMREEYGYKHPIKYTAETKWLIKLIREEAQALLREKKAAEAKKITIDYSQLAKIRREAAVTRDKLTVEDETEADEVEEAMPVQDAAPAAQPLFGSSDADHPLSAPEYRLLQCLLYGRSTAWVQQEGYMLSVLTDSINEKLYDIFLDSVLDDTSAPIKDYTEDLKEMVTP